MNMMTPIIRHAVTIDDLMAAADAAHARSGLDGYFMVHLRTNTEYPCHVTHWRRPDPYSSEVSSTVYIGPVDGALDALERYAAVPAIAAE